MGFLENLSLYSSAQVAIRLETNRPLRLPTVPHELALVIEGVSQNLGAVCMYAIKNKALCSAERWWLIPQGMRTRSADAARPLLVGTATTGIVDRDLELLGRTLVDQGASLA
jgi:hypothetical protein